MIEPGRYAGEPSGAYEAFKLYVTIPHHIRTFDALAGRLGDWHGYPAWVARLAARWDWAERSVAYERQILALARIGFEAKRLIDADELRESLKVPFQQAAKECHRLLGLGEERTGSAFTRMIGMMTEALPLLEQAFGFEGNLEQTALILQEREKRAAAEWSELAGTICRVIPERTDLN